MSTTKQTIAVTSEIPVEPYVIVTSDVDCDGIGYGYHRVLLPPVLARDAKTARWFAVLTEQMSGYGDACEVMTEVAFELGPVWGNMDDFSRKYWRDEGYHGVFYRR